MVHLKGVQIPVREREGSLRTSRGDSRGLAALPGPLDHVPYDVRGHLTSEQKSLPGRHDLFFPLWAWEGRERFLRCHVAFSIRALKLLRGRDNRVPVEQSGQANVSRAGMSGEILG